jgi:type I restriction enzyme R subunit
MGTGPNEVDTCAEFVFPAILDAGWDSSQIIEQFAVRGDLHPGVDAEETLRKRRADYVLELKPGVPLIVIEAKRLWSLPGDGLQQAIRYAVLLDAPFALSTNGRGWVLHNLVTGLQAEVDSVPTPVEAWDLFTDSHNLNLEARALLLAPFNRNHREADGSVRQLRYYQRRAIHEVLVAMTKKKTRLLLVMATGTGKTFTAMQLVWKLWNYRREEQRQNNGLSNFRVLYLADRDILVKDPLNKTFVKAFPEQAAMRVNKANKRHSPDLYFATYQAFDVSANDADDLDESNELLTNYPSNFFDLVIVDECHRGSAREDSAWRGILEHFSPATQLGLTATPVNKGAADTFDYFGNPIYEYSLREGIQDGFLAPYSIRRVIFNVDSEGLEIVDGLVDLSGREVPAGVYSTRDFERVIKLPDRTNAMAKIIDRVIGNSGDRAVVFCVDSEHALAMVKALRDLRPDRTRLSPEWAVRIMSAERDKARLLEEFTDSDRDTPQIAVTSRLLSTGVDIQDLRFVIIARSVGSAPEFKQIIGRGTRLYPDKGKYEFEIMDFVGATAIFKDKQFDGPPLKNSTVETVDEEGEPIESLFTDEDVVVQNSERLDSDDLTSGAADDFSPLNTPGVESSQKFVLQGISVDVVSEGFWVHDMGSGRPRLLSYIDWTRERLMKTFEYPSELLAAWSKPEGREGVMSILRGAHVDPARLAQELGLDSESSIDLVDQLLQLAWDLPAPTRSERSSSARSRHTKELDGLSHNARTLLGLLLDIYAARGIEEISSPAIVQVPPMSEHGTPAQIAGEFGGPVQWHEARMEVQRWLYSA